MNPNPAARCFVDRVEELYRCPKDFFIAHDPDRTGHISKDNLEKALSSLRLGLAPHEVSRRG